MSDQTTHSPDPPNHRQTSMHVAELFALHPVGAITLVIADQMLFAGELGSGFLLVFLSFVVGMALTVPVTLLQRYAANDHWGVAVSKGLIAGILTAIPTSLCSVITGAAGVIGLLAMQQARRNHDNTNDHNHYGDN